MTFSNNNSHVRNNNLGDLKDCNDFSFEYDNFTQFLQGRTMYLEKALIGGSLAGNNLILPTAVSDQIINNLTENSEILNLCDKEVLENTSSLCFIVDSNDYGAKWVEEGVEVEDYQDKPLEKLEIDAHEIAVCPAVSNKLIETSNIGSRLESELEKSLKKTLVFSIFNGKDKNQPAGILHRSETENKTGPIKKIALEEDNILKQLREISFSLGSDLSASAAWFMSREFMKKIDGLVLEALKETRFRSCDDIIFKYDNNKRSISFLGYPVFIEDALDEFDGCIFGNLKKGYKLLVGKQITMIRDNLSKKGLVQFYTSARFGGDVINPKAFIVCNLAEKE